MTLARNLGAVVLAAAWLLSAPQGTFSQANAQAQSPSPGPSDRTTAIPDQKLDAAAAVLERIASLKESRKLCREAGDAKAKIVAAVVTLARADRAMAATADQWNLDAEVFNARRMEET